MSIRAIVGTLAVALAVVGSAVTATPSSASSTPQAAAEDRIDESPDAATAMAAAQSQGHRVEDLSQRTEATQVFANPDGSWTSESAAGPVRALDDTGEWADIDLSLERIPGGYAPVNAIDDLVISDGGDGTFAKMIVDGRELAWKWPDGSLPVPTVEGNTATYANVVDGGDLVVTATPSGFRHDIVLHQAPADPVSFRIPIVTGGPVVAEEGDGDLTVTTRGGDELVSAPQPVMYDAPDPATGQPEHQVDLDTTITKTASGAVMTLDPAEAFLDAPSTTYPVTVDPTWNSTNPDDTWIYDTSPTAVHPYDDTLYAGTPNAGTDRYRTLVKFNGGGVWAGQVVSAASLTLRNFYSPNVGSDCIGAAVEVRKVTTAWTPGSANWNNQPSTTTTSAVTNAQAKGNTYCAAADVSWNVTPIVQSWAAGTANYGFRIAAYDETKSASYRKYRSAGYTTSSAWPQLSVTYNSYPNTPTNLSISPMDSSNHVTGSAPTLSAKVVDPDGGTLHGVFTIMGADGTTIWSSNGSTVASNSMSTVPIPEGLISADNSYTLRVGASDGSLPSKALASIAFDTIGGTVSLAGLTVGADGWITYNDTSVQTDLDLTPGDITTLTGTTSTEGCEFDEAAGLQSDVPAIAVEVGYNPSTCQERVQITPLTAAATDELEAQDSSAEATATAEATSPERYFSADFDQALQGADAEAAATLTYPNSEWAKMRWLDPLNIEITSLKETIKWTYGYRPTAAFSAVAKAWVFSIDVTHISSLTWHDYTRTNNTVSEGVRASYWNSSFAKIVVARLGTAGWIACGLWTNPRADFSHDITMTGDTWGGASASWHNTKHGACTNLVHHKNNTSWGYMSIGSIGH